MAQDASLNYLNWDIDRSKHGWAKFWSRLTSWLMSIDHKRIGLMYLGSILFFFVFGGLMALLVRLELFTPGAGPVFGQGDGYNRAFTAHGLSMIFFFIVPGIPATLGNIMLPLMIGAKDVAFPRLNRFSYWIYLSGVPFGLAGIHLGVDTGWTFYSPYSIETNGTAVVLVVIGAFLLGFSSILTGLNFLVTIHNMRAPGMRWDRVPLFVWSLYATSILQVVATPVIGITMLLLILENVMHVGVFDPALGGDPILFQHFFWFYSHPVVYIMILPAFGIISEIIPVFSQKPIFGYKSMVFAVIGIAIISFVVWGHHMFVTGMSNISRYVFSFITFFVAIPTAIKVFNWVSTMYKGSISFASPMLYAFGFVFLFMIAGTTGIHLATVGLDAHYHDTYFVVAHFHYTIQGGAVIGLYAGLHFWFPKIFGKAYNEKLAIWSWALIFIGFNGTFLPQFALGMMGMPRRYFTYPEEFQTLHQVSTVFALVNALGYSLVLLNFGWSIWKGKRTVENPWRSLSLEWTTPSPPPHENFPVIPRIHEWTYGYGAPQNGHRFGPETGTAKSAEEHTHV